MKNIFTLIFTLLSFMQQSQTWSWAQSPVCNPNGEADGNAMCIDKAGNVFISGLGDGILSAGNYSTSGGSAYFIKYSSLGNPLWAKSNGNSLAIPLGANTDANGNSYLSGYFNYWTFFGNYTLTASSEQMFLVKFDPNGNILWARNPALGHNRGYSTCCDPSGNVYVTGTFDSTSVFGTYTLNTNFGTINMFIVKYDSNGNLLWAQQSSGNQLNAGYSVTSDASGNAYVTGAFQSPTVAFGTSTLANGGLSNMFFVKYDVNGNVQWIKSGFDNGGGTDKGISVSFDGNSNIYLAAGFNGTQLSLGNFTISNPSGYYNMLLAKYDLNGNLVWARTSSNGDCLIRSMSASENNIFLCGAVTDTFCLGNYTLSPPQVSDPAFIAQYDSSGTPVYVSMLDSGGDDYLGVCVDYSCHAYISGDFMPATFTLGTNTLTLSGASEAAFVAKLSYSCQGQPDGMVEHSESNSPVVIFPNPNSGNFIVRVNASAQDVQMVIMDYTGRKVCEEKLSAGENIISTTLPEGLYFYRIREGSGKTTEGKIIIR